MWLVPSICVSIVSHHMTQRIMNTVCTFSTAQDQCVTNHCWNLSWDVWYSSLTWIAKSPAKLISSCFLIGICCAVQIRQQDNLLDLLLLPWLRFAWSKKYVKQSSKNINASDDLKNQRPWMTAVKDEPSAIYAEGLHNAWQPICQPKNDASKLCWQILHQHKTHMKQACWQMSRQWNHAVQCMHWGRMGQAAALTRQCCSAWLRMSLAGRRDVPAAAELTKKSTKWLTHYSPRHRQALYMFCLFKMCSKLPLCCECNVICKAYQQWSLTGGEVGQHTRWFDAAPDT